MFYDKMKTFSTSGFSFARKYKSWEGKTSRFPFISQLQTRAFQIDLCGFAKIVLDMLLQSAIFNSARDLGVVGMRHRLGLLS